MKLIILITFLVAAFSSQAQVVKLDGRLYLQNPLISHNLLKNKAIKTIFSFKRVNIGEESIDGEIEILSDYIIHQNLKVYVVNPVTGNLSQVDLDEKSDYYGSVDIVSGLVVKHYNKLYLVNPSNGKTKRIKY